MLVHALVISRLDHCNAILFGTPASLLHQHQVVMNAAARLLFGANGRDHVSPLLDRLHWLHITERVAFKVACLTWRCLRGLGPAYLINDLRQTSTMCRRTGLRSDSSQKLVIPRTRLVNYGDRSWPCAAAKVWNNLSPFLRTELNYMNFRRVLKTFLCSSS